MSLIPLPTKEASVGASRHSNLPYPKIGTAHSQPKPKLTKQWDGKQQQNASEKKRLVELEEMLSEAQSRTAIVEQEAYDKAYAAGEKAGLALGEKRAEQILESMAKILTEAERELYRLQYKSVDVVMELTEAITREVVGQSPKDVQKVLEHGVAQAIEQLDMSEGDKLVLSVHPHDLEMFKRIHPLPVKISIDADGKVEQGSCKLLTKHHDILIDPKGMIDKALQHIKQQFLQAYEK